MSFIIEYIKKNKTSEIEYSGNKIKEEDSQYCNAIIMDDQGAYLKNKETRKLLKELIFNRRHLRTSIYFYVKLILVLIGKLENFFQIYLFLKFQKKNLN